eukprot:11856159-Alexandrium_andersonii.AAC.1
MAHDSGAHSGHGKHVARPDRLPACVRLWAHLHLLSGVRLGEALGVLAPAPPARSLFRAGARWPPFGLPCS